VVVYSRQLAIDPSSMRSSCARGSSKWQPLPSSLFCLPPCDPRDPHHAWKIPNSSRPTREAWEGRGGVPVPERHTCRVRRNLTTSIRGAENLASPIDRSSGPFRSVEDNQSSSGPVRAAKVSPTACSEHFVTAWVIVNMHHPQ
jgi:hypothetical protein